MPHNESGTEVYTKREIFGGRGAGKGDMRRGQQISDEEMADNWARVFGKPPRPGVPRPICGPIQWTPCPKCKRVTSVNTCSDCGSEVAHRALNVVGSDKCQINTETQS